MANTVYVPFRNGQLGAYTTMVDMDGDTLKLVLSDAAEYTPNTTTHDFFDDVTSASRAPAAQGGPVLGGKTIGTPAGVFDASDTVFTSLTGDPSEYLILYKATGTDSTSPVIAIWDTATGLPITPNGANITVVWAAGGIITN